MANDDTPKESDVDRYDVEISKFLERLKGTDTGMENAIDEAVKRVAERDYEMRRADVEIEDYGDSDRGRPVDEDGGLKDS